MVSTLCTTLDGSWAIKDSFATLNLEPLGFKPLFEAQWLRLDPSQPRSASTSSLRWSPVPEESDLELWELAWRVHQDTDVPRIFPYRLLDLKEISIIAGRDDPSGTDPIVAGFITCRTEGVVGISNLFGPGGREEEIRASATNLVSDVTPNLPIVDYERLGSEELAIAERVGYEGVGPLRVWAC